MTVEALSTGHTSANQTRSARRDLLELVVGYGLVLATIWTANPIQRVLYWLAFAWIVATTWARREGWTALGLGRKGLLQSLWIVGVALLLSAGAIFIASRTHTLHRLHGPTPIYLHGWGYIVWSVMQQFLLQSYFLLRLLRLLPGKVAPIIVATGIFALAHLPNPILTPITLVWGAISCILFLRYRNIYTLGLAHGIMGLCVAVTVPNSLHHHMRVGLGYLRYHPRVQNRRLADRHLTDPRYGCPIQAVSLQTESPPALRVGWKGWDVIHHPATESGAPYLDFEMWAFAREARTAYSSPAKAATHLSHHRSQSDQSVSTDAWVIADAPTRRS